MKLLQDKYSMNDTVHLTAVPGISVAKGGERKLASAEVQESDTVRYVGPFDLRGGQAVFRFDGGHIYISLKDDHQPHFFYYHLKDHLGSNRVTKVGVGDYSEILETFQSTGNVTATRNVWNKETSAEQHNDVIKAGGGILRGTNNYKRTSSELIKRFPNLKSIFDIMHKEYEKRYK